ncbi:MAG: HEAT repeat domain-containing protein [Deltaproteobacteria bacterium]|nr:HEAT repeat domain-containing protein [Deltaproteobacteria bacterium]
MRTSRLATRLTLAAALCLGAASLTGCENENDPATWVGKLSATNKRPAAMRRLRQMWESKLATTTPPNNLRDPAVQAFLNAVLPAVNEAFVDHRDELAVRKEAIEILAGSGDARAIPALLNALEFSPGNSESERIALRAAQALKELHPANNPQVVQRLLATIDRASGNSGSAPAIREAVIQALGAIGDRSAVDVLVRTLKKPIDQQEIRTARAAADALGLLGDTSQPVVDALIYGLYLNVRRANAFNNCGRALTRLGAAAVVPRLIATVNGQNPEVTLLINSFASVPGMPPVPPGLQQSTAIDVLRNFADRSAVPALIALLTNRETVGNVRGAAAETLGYTGLALPADAPERGPIFTALSTVFNEGTPGGEDDMAPTVAPALVLLGDARTVPLLVRRISTREMSAPSAVQYRLGLLMPLASAVRHDTFAQFDTLATTAAAQLAAMVAESPGDADLIRPVQAQLATIRQVASVAHDCPDGDLACYRERLSSPEKNVVRKAAYMIAWTGGDNPAARQALLAQAGNADLLVRRSIHVAIDALSPHGCAECITRLEQVIESERGQESKSLLHLEAQMLISRLRGRT